MKDAALRYAQQGHHVFPLMPGTKQPFPGSEGFKDATTNLDQIRKWWTEHPDANIGFWPGGSKLVAIDLDPGHEPVDLPVTTTIRTPHGEHHYYFSESEFTNRKLGSHIDVRATNGYTLLPPSVVGGLAYHGDISGWCEELPTWVAEKLNTVKRINPSDTLERIVYDNPANIARAREMLRRTNPETDGYTIACQLCRDLALPVNVAVELFVEWNKTLDWQWDEGGITERCENAAKYGHDQGVRAVDEISYPVPPNANENGSQQRKSRFAMRTPEQDKEVAELTYYDNERTLPNVPGGAVMVITGQKSSHKTGLVIKKCLDAMVAGARVLFLAAEGGHGVMKIRLPLYQKVREIPWAVLNERWRTLSTGMNLFTERRELIEELKAQKFEPNIVVMDTLTKVSGGEDINAPATGSGIHNAADEIAAAFGALVILIHHPGKAGKDSMGSALIEALAYAVWHVSKEGDTVKCWIEKMKDGAAEFTASYRIAQAQGVPYVRDETPDEAKEAIKDDDVSDLRGAILQVLRDQKQDVAFKDMLELLQDADAAVWTKTPHAFYGHMKTHTWSDLTSKKPWRFRYIEDVA